MPGYITAILDANVLYPFLLRDLLLSLAQQYLYVPKWTDDIEMEWSSHLIQDRPDIETHKISRIADEMNRYAEKVKQAMEKMINRRRNPPVSVTELINRIQNTGLTQSAKRFQVLFKE